MFIDMILKTIPRSWRAAVALVGLLLGSGVLLSALQQLVTPGAGAGAVVKFLLGLVTTVPAAICFYYFQFKDSQARAYSDLEVLNSAYKNEQAAKQVPKIEPAWPKEANEKLNKNK
jgi:hypothetical protein